MEWYPLQQFKGINGFIFHWWLSGPYNMDGGMSSCDALQYDFLEAYGGEASAFANVKMDETALSLYKPYKVKTGYKVDFLPLAKKSGAIMYALAYVKCVSERSCSLKYGTDDGFALWVNGKKLAQEDVHRGCALDENETVIHLQEGINTIIFKVENNYGGYEFCTRLDGDVGENVIQCYGNEQGDVHPRGFSQNAFLVTMGEREPQMSCDLSGETEFYQWQQAFREKLKGLLGWVPDKAALRPQVLEKVDCGSYWREKVVFHSDENSLVPAYVLIPKAAGAENKCPAMLAIHGHGSGKNAVADVHNGNEQLKEAWKASNYDYGVKWVKEGYVVLVPDLRPFGERGNENLLYQDACDMSFNKSVLMGMTTLGLNLFDLSCALDYLETRPEVSPSFGCTGLSYGGTVSIFLFALEPRIRSAIISGALTSYREHLWNGGICGSQIVPGLFRYGDLCDVLLLGAPKTLAVESGLYDSGFTKVYYLEEHGKLQQAYQLLNQGDRLCIHVFEGGHRFEGSQTMPFIKQWQLQP